jgi:hypothetical protein
LEKEERAEFLTNVWMGSNLQYKGIKEVLQEMSRKVGSSNEEPTVEEVNNDWKRLASFMSGKT